MSNQKFSRRDALKGMLAAAAAPAILPARMFGQEAPSNRVRVAFIGTGNQGMNVLKKLQQYDLAQVVAICDVNRGSYGYLENDHFYGREPGQKLVDEHNAQKQKGAAEPCSGHTDFREVLDRKDIDAVFIVVPDHWHAPITLAACQAGKDIYCEKPLALTVAEGREMIHAVRKHDRVLQTGTMERSNPVTRYVAETVKRGAIGRLQRIHDTIAQNNKVGPGPGWMPEPVPEGFDYAQWLGPAPDVPFHHDRCLYRFRFNYDYSGGQITNQGAHTADIAHWAMGLDRGGPVEVQCLAAEFLPQGSLFNTATVTKHRALYENGVEMICTTATSPESYRIRFEGDQGWIQLTYKGITSSDQKLVDEGPDADAVAKEMHRLGRHIKDFIDCIKTRQDPIAPVEQGHAGAAACHVANIAIRRFPLTGPDAIYRWDPKQERFLDNDAANAMLARERRAPWEKLS